MPMPLYVSNQKGENVPVRAAWITWLYVLLFVVAAELGAIVGILWMLLAQYGWNGH